MTPNRSFDTDAQVRPCALRTRFVRRSSPTLCAMRQVTATYAFVMLAISAVGCYASGFAEALLEDEGHTLILVRADGVRSSAPKLEDQDSFAAPAVASNHEYAGWLAMFPNRGASYSQPIYLVVSDSRNRLNRFSGKWGMVFGWCFATQGAVVYKYEFPHGITSVAFDMRRISDGRLLRRVVLDPPRLGMDEGEMLRGRAPSWTRCAQHTRLD